MNRLKTVQRNTSCKMPSRSNEKTCGPRMEENICLTDQLTGDDCQEAISLLKHSSDRDIIFWKMKETFQYRQEIVKDPMKSMSIFHIFPRFLDTKGLVSIQASWLILASLLQPSPNVDYPVFSSDPSRLCFDVWPGNSIQIFREVEYLLQGKCD